VVVAAVLAHARHAQLEQVGNAPLFTWIVAAVWWPTRSPVAVARFVALANALSLFPCGVGRRQMDEQRSLLTLGICAVSPFAVIFSRKIWTQNLLLPGVIAMLWGLEWLRGERPWRGVASLGLAILLMGQLHQSAAIALLFLPVALAVQLLAERIRGRRDSPGHRRSARALSCSRDWAQRLFLAAVSRVPAPPAAQHPDQPPKLDTVSLHLLRKVAAQVRPIDLFYFFDPDREDFLRGMLRPTLLRGRCARHAAVLYGCWRWVRAPLALPCWASGGGA